MSDYIILPRTKQIAKENNLTIKTAKNPKYKIDVLDKNKNLTSIGATGYADYPNYLNQEKAGNVKPGYADKRRKLYLIRHKDDDKIKGKLAKLLLWS
jgi:hypothetical protein